MLAFQSETFIKSAMTDLKQVTADTIVDRTRLSTELSQIRRTGISVSRGAWQLGVDGIAAPIRDAGGNVVAGVGISGPAIRLRSRERARYAPLIAETAARISQALGFNSPQRRSRESGTQKLPPTAARHVSGASSPNASPHHY
jgi:DNA-binding IclR family transcriptional regulator